MALGDLTVDDFRWFSLGQAVRRGKATMYSYNGVVLPKLPDSTWDKTVYPYAIIIHVPLTGNYYLQVLPSLPYWTGSGIYKPPCTYQEWRVRELGTYWVRYSDAAESDGWLIKDPYVFVWTNTDILDEDGSVYFAASEPVPVYE